MIKKSQSMALFYCKKFQKERGHKNENNRIQEHKKASFRAV